ncbi:MAG TPA: DUF1501 domain-containing protein [Marmoricola sp.]|nr:DUF1501 domain-containing protein [Marmoricola sp.]
MTQPAACCDDFQSAALSRRRFLGGMAAAGATGVATTLFGDAVRQASFAASTGGNVMIVLSFRGGIDGLGMVVPHGDPGYYSARRGIAVPAASLVAKDATFGLHPGMKPLEWLWRSGEFAAVQAVGLEQPNRSHFAAMEAVEDADPGSSLRQGWVNRMVGLDADATAREVVHLGGATPPTLIEGTAPSVATRQLRGIDLVGSKNGWKARRRAQLDATWRRAPGPLGAAARSALETVDALGPLGAQAYRPAVRYPTGFPATDLSAALQDTAHLIKADVGTEVVSIDFGSWDMHSNYGTVEAGEMTRMVAAFAQCVSAFMEDLGPLRSKVTLVTISEFGRRVEENGNRGLDHGWGNMMLVMGGGVRGGRYYGSWPGLGAGSQADGDLKVTTDYRQVLGEVVHTRFRDKAVSRVFPGLPYTPLGILANVPA